MLTALSEFGADVEFFEPGGRAAVAVSGTPILVPLTDLALIVAAGRDCPAASVVAVGADLNGKRTHAAIEAGATWVINLAIPLDRGLDEFVRWLGLKSLRHDIDDEVMALARLLRTDETVGSLARRFFCSERTMYRKVRSVYERFRVANRAELRLVLATRATNWESEDSLDLLLGPTAH